MCWRLYTFCDFIYMVKIQNRSINHNIKGNKLHHGLPVIKKDKDTRILSWLWPWMKVSAVPKHVTYTYKMFFL